MTQISNNIQNLVDINNFYQMHTHVDERDYNISTALIKNIDKFFSDMESSVLDAYCVYLKSLDNVEDAKMVEISNIPEYPPINNRKGIIVTRNTDKKHFQFYIKDREGMFEIREREDNYDKCTSIKVGKTPYPDLEFFLTNTYYAFTINSWSQKSMERRN